MSYNFISDVEPTDQQLEMLMQAVLEDVKKRAALAAEQFKILQSQQIKEALGKAQPAQAVEEDGQ